MENTNVKQLTQEESVKVLNGKWTTPYTVFDIQVCIWDCNKN